MRNKHIIPLLLSLITIIGCTGGKVENRHGTQAIDTFYTGVRALSVHGTQPERALRILDSAVIVGNLSDFRADVLRAKVYGAAIETFQLDSSIIIGERLMLHDSIKADPDLQEDVLNILLNACRLRHDDERTLYWATQLCELYRQRNEKVEALRTDAEIGMLLVRLGDQRRGLERIDSVIHLLEGKRKFNEMDASIIALKRKAEICCQKELFHELIPVGKRMLELLSDYEKYPQDYHDGNYREPPEDKRPNYIDFYRGKAYGYLAMAYAPSMEANRFIELFDKTDYGQTLDGKYFIAMAREYMGQYDRMLDAYDEYCRAMDDDTLNFTYAEIMLRRSKAAKVQGRYADAYELLSRYTSLSQHLNDSLLQGKAHLYAARFHAQEQQQEIARQKEGKRYIAMMAFLIGALALLGLFFAWFAARQWRKTQLKNKVLAQQIKLVYSMHETATVGVESSLVADGSMAGATATSISSHEKGDEAALDSLSPEELFHYIEREVSRRLLFLNPSFGRQMIMDEFHLSKERVGAAFSKGSKYDSLPQFVNDLRLEYASKLLVTTELPISEILAEAGFSNASVFSRYFSRKFQISPSQYRRANRT